MFFNAVQGAISERFAWLYVLSMTGFLVFALWLCFGPFGTIRLGRDNEQPEFPAATWFAMLFSAGMGIGLLFFGVAEPMTHFTNPPVGEAQTLEAARLAMGITLFHWGLHPWALYALVALALAYFGFRRGLPLSFRSVFYPVLGKKVYGPIGDAIDVLAICATLFGLATSLGVGAKQVNAGFHHVFGLPQSTQIQIVLIGAVLSLISGLHAGIRRLSELNMMLAGSLLVFLFIFGPTVYLLNAMADNIGAYLERVPANSFWTATYEKGSQASWFSNWTVFYWAWWIAWSPFVGMFIARVSRGRTIREFITAVLLVPSERVGGRKGRQLARLAKSLHLFRRRGGVSPGLKNETFDDSWRAVLPVRRPFCLPGLPVYEHIRPVSREDRSVPFGCQPVTERRRSSPQSSLGAILRAW